MSSMIRRGYGVFGRPYEIMLKNDLHAPESIDHALLRDMILLDEESYPLLYTAPVRRDLSSHELYSFAQRFLSTDERTTVRNVLDFTSGIALNYNVDFRDMLFGGTEKQILERGTDWCADMARVGAVLLQCLGIPCRIVHLADLSKAYYGHVVGEAYYEGHWGAVDFIYGYQFLSGRPASAYDIMHDPSILAQCSDEYRGYYSAVAISEYDPANASNDYTVSKPNEYCMKLIYTDHNGRWIMGEADE